MAKLKSKYQRDESELIDSLIRKGKRTFITQIQLIETSKVKNHLIYEIDLEVKYQRFLLEIELQVNSLPLNLIQD